MRSACPAGLWLHAMLYAGDRRRESEYDAGSAAGQTLSRAASVRGLSLEARIRRIYRPLGDAGVCGE